MKTEITHKSDCSVHNEPYIKNETCDCCPSYTIEPIRSRAINNAAENGEAIHEGETDARIDYFEAGGEYVKTNSIEILKLKMNPDCSLSAKEYWYLCGIKDAIDVLKQF